MEILIPYTAEYKCKYIACVQLSFYTYEILPKFEGAFIELGEKTPENKICDSRKKLFQN